VIAMLYVLSGPISFWVLVLVVEVVVTAAWVLDAWRRR
jgi:hypothetical protein